MAFKLKHPFSVLCPLSSVFCPLSSILCILSSVFFLFCPPVIGNTTIPDTLFKAECREYCYNPAVLGGSIDTFLNSCADDKAFTVDFMLNEESLCVIYCGINIGLDTACLVICNDEGKCDSVTLVVFVVESDEPPVAQPDFDTTFAGNSILVDFKNNDERLGGVDRCRVLSGPMYGEVVMNLDCSLTYGSDPDECGVVDRISYEICNSQGCDTGLVSIWVECSGIEVFNALSPNNDGFNDVFFIEGIENFPESTLSIYNRWGNLVFKEKAYKNTWTGSTLSGKLLPSGTYFYVLELNGPRYKGFLKGYLELVR